MSLDSRVAGSFSNLTNVTNTPAANDVLYMEVQGTSIVVKLNGSTIAGLNTTDANVASGKPGLMWLGETGVTIGQLKGT